MPLDIPREDDFDDSLPDIPDYQLMNIANDDHNDDDSDFDFSSDDEDAPTNAIAASEGDNSDRYANYELINQDNEANVLAESAAGQENTSESEAQNNQARNRFFPQNYIVGWIETDEPLFDRTDPRVRQAWTRTQGTNSNNQTARDDSTSQTNTTVSASENASRQSQTDECANQPNEPSSSQSDNQTQNEEKLDNGKYWIMFSIATHSNRHF